MSDVDDRTDVQRDTGTPPGRAQAKTRGEATLLLVVAVVMLAAGAIGVAAGNAAQGALLGTGVVFLVLGVQRARRAAGAPGGSSRVGAGSDGGAATVEDTSWDGASGGDGGGGD